MDDILKKIGFRKEEIISYEWEIQQFAKNLKLNKFSIDKSEKSLGENFDLSFISIKLLLKKLFLVVLNDLSILKKGEKETIQMAIPMPNVIPAVINELNSNKHITSSEYLIVYLSGIIFDVYSNICFSGSNNCKRCGLNISREALYENPDYLKPQGIMSCLAYCDELHKTGEMLNIQHKITHYNLSNINGIAYEDKKDYLIDSIKIFIEDQTNVSNQIIEENLKRNNNKSLEINLLLNSINTLIAKEKSVYVSFNEISLLNILNLIYFDDLFDKGKIILNMFIKELKTRIKNGEYIVENPIRLGCMHLPFTNPRVDRAFLGNSAAVIVSSMYFTDGKNALYENEYDRSAQAFLKNKESIKIEEMANFIDCLMDKYKLDGFLFGQFENDRALGNHQTIIMKLIKNKEKAYYMSTNNWQEINQSYFDKIENLTYIIHERLKGV